MVELKLSKSLLPTYRLKYL